VIKQSHTCPFALYIAISNPGICNIPAQIVSNLKPPMAPGLSSPKNSISYGLLLSAVLVAVCVAGSAYLPGMQSSKVSPATFFFLSRLLFWATLAIVYFYCIKIESQPLLLWKNQKQGLKHVCISIFIILISVLAGSTILRLIAHVFKWGADSAAVARLIAYGAPLKLFIVITAAVTEELLFRGYLMPRLQLYFKNAWATIVVSALVFGLAHFHYATFVNIAGPVLIGFIFAWYYQKYRNITVLIICHFVIDFIGLFLLR
jgi:membrane protease YdiL (CAAX protease family)